MIFKTIFCKKIFKFQNHRFCFSDVTSFLDKLSKQPKRTEKVNIIKQYMQSEIGKQRVLDIAKIISKNYMIEQEAHLSQKLIQKALEEGELNLLRQNIRWEELMARINKIKFTTGLNSEEKKYEQLVEIFSRKLSDKEIKLVKNILLNNVRVGAGVKTFYKCIQDLQKKDQIQKEEVEQLEQIFKRKMDDSIIQPFFTVQPMLAQILQDVEDLQKKLKKDQTDIIVEQKYDGQRIQIHYDRENGCRLYSRSLEDITEKHKFLQQHINMNFYVFQIDKRDNTKLYT